MVDPKIPLRDRVLELRRPNDEQPSREKLAQLFIAFYKKYLRWPICPDIKKMHEEDPEIWPGINVFSRRGGIPSIKDLAKETLAKEDQK